MPKVRHNPGFNSIAGRAEWIDVFVTRCQPGAGLLKLRDVCLNNLRFLFPGFWSFRLKKKWQRKSFFSSICTGITKAEGSRKYSKYVIYNEYSFGQKMANLEQLHLINRCQIRTIKNKTLRILQRYRKCMDVSGKSTVTAYTTWSSLTIKPQTYRSSLI